MKIILLEDNEFLATELKVSLEKYGHTVQHFLCGDDLIAALPINNADIYLLDWNVPGKTGLEVLLILREKIKENLPVIFISSMCDEEAVIAALSAGADDYCIKPLRLNELFARMQALIRRVSQNKFKDAEIEEVHLPYRFNTKTQEAWINDVHVKLTEKEFELALFFFRNKELPLSRDQLMDNIWGKNSKILTRTVDVHVAWIRKKLKIDLTNRPYQLRSVHGLGYRLTYVD